MSMELPRDLLPQLATSAAPTGVELAAPLPVAPPVRESEYVRSSYTGLQRLTATGIAVVAGATTGLVGVMVEPKPTGFDKIYTFDELYPADPLPTDTTEAPAPQSDATTWVQSWMGKPTNPRLVNFYEDAYTIYQQGEGKGDQIDIQRELLFQIRKETAAAYGLTVFDSSPTIYRMRQDLEKNKGQSLTFEESLGLANEYLANFGVTIGFDNTVEYAHNLQAPVPGEFDTVLAKRHLYSIVDAFSRLPLEYIQDTGITRLLLATQKPNTKMTAGAYIYPNLEGPEGAAYVYNISSGSDINTTFHELWHRWDYLLSGGSGMNQDPYFVELNRGAPYGAGQKDIEKGVVTARDQGFHTVSDFWQNFNKTYSEFQSHIGEADCLNAAATATTKMLKIGGMTVFVSSYAGQSNVAEQKAETAENIAGGNTYILSPWMPSIRAQYLTELIRLANYRPEYAAFFISMTDYHNQSDTDTLNFFANACKPQPVLKGGSGKGGDPLQGK